jgi:hypothetical protein
MNDHGSCRRTAGSSESGNARVGWRSPVTSYSRIAALAYMNKPLQLVKSGAASISESTGICATRPLIQEERVGSRSGALPSAPEALRQVFWKLLALFCTAITISTVSAKSSSATIPSYSWHSCTSPVKSFLSMRFVLSRSQSQESSEHLLIYKDPRPLNRDKELQENVKVIQGDLRQCFQLRLLIILQWLEN